MTAQQVATTAGNYLTSLNPKATNIQLEEIERAGTGSIWILTLSYDSPESTGFIGTNTRKYKVFRIQNSNGMVISMKMK